MVLRSLLIAIAIAGLAACSKQSKQPPERDQGKDALPPPASEAKLNPEVGATSTLVWLHDLETAQAQAAEQERDLLIDFSAVWCAPCEEMEKTTFADADIGKFLSERFVPLKLDVSEQSDADKALMARFSVKVLPALLVVRGDEVVLAINTYIGPRDLEVRLIRLLDAQGPPN